MMEPVYIIIRIIAYIVLAPVVGGLLAGFDRKITARMQGRKGPSVLQPFYDVAVSTKETDMRILFFSV